MPIGLTRLQQTGNFHAINFCCFRKRPILGTPQSRDKFLKILEQTRQKYSFEVLGYVVMPDHVHLLLTEPTENPLSTAIQVIKQRFSRTCEEPEVCERRYYDFNVYTPDKFKEKLRYIHRNPIRRGLVTEPDQWQWSSFTHYLNNTEGPVKLSR